jgi:hypothetical protein
MRHTGLAIFGVVWGQFYVSVFYSSASPLTAFDQSQVSMLLKLVVRVFNLPFVPSTSVISKYVMTCSFFSLEELIHVFWGRLSSESEELMLELGSPAANRM